jgi:putative lipoprotein
MINKTILSAILAGATILTLSGCFDSGASGSKAAKVDKPSGKIAKSLKEVCDNPNTKYDALVADLKVKMLDINDKADKWVFFYDQDSQDFKITARTMTTDYQIQHLVIPQIEFINVHLEMQEPTCRIESNPDKEKILQDKYITDKEAAEYEKVIPVRKIIKVKEI